MLRYRPSTIQITGTIVSLVLGIIGGWAAVQQGSVIGAVKDGLVLGLLSEILTFIVDIYYGPLGDSKYFYDTIRSSPVLRYYEDCITEYDKLRTEYRGSGELGRTLEGWLDDKVRRHHYEVEADWKNGRLRFGQDEVAARAVQMQRCITYGGFATQLERSTSFWESAQEYLEITRELARTGKTITRVFILNSPESLSNGALRAQISNDRQSGIKTLVAYVSQLSADAIRDFGLWDDKLLCLVTLTPVGGYVTGCTYSMRAEDIDRGKSWQEEITRRAVFPGDL